MAGCISNAFSVLNILTHLTTLLPFGSLSELRHVTISYGHVSELIKPCADFKKWSCHPVGFGGHGPYLEKKRGIFCSSDRQLFL